ncbi:hypothetical protein C9J03_26225 [Photobacterium gaetbulicola]|nr:hypothetical protein C9J03_26225 [Photobacterium gaetbulicola]
MFSIRLNTDTFLPGDEFSPGMKKPSVGALGCFEFFIYLAASFDRLTAKQKRCFLQMTISPISQSKPKGGQLHV